MNSLPEVLKGEKNHGKCIEKKLELELTTHISCMTETHEPISRFPLTLAW